MNYPPLDGRALHALKNFQKILWTSIADYWSFDWTKGQSVPAYDTYRWPGRLLTSNYPLRGLAVLVLHAGDAVAKQTSQLADRS